MAKTLLIPTDFTVASLYTVKQSLEHVDRVRIVLMYAESLNDSITDLLLFRPHKKLQSHLNRDFSEALEIITNRFETKLYGPISIHGFHGTNKNAMINFLDAHRVDEIVVPEDFVFKTNRQLVNPMQLLAAANRPIRSIRIPQSTTQNHITELISLFQ